MQDIALLSGFQGTQAKYLVYGFKWRKPKEGEPATWDDSHPRFYVDEIVMLNLKTLQLERHKAEVVEAGINAGKLTPWTPPNFETTFKPNF